MYLFSDKNIEPYLTFNSQISNIKQEENDSFEYYYYLSEKDGENDIKDWVKIDKEIENNKLSFEVNSRELKNFDILGEKESVFMYIKEIAKKGNDQKVLVKQFKIQDKQEMEIYIDNKILESDNNNTEEENKEENKDDTTAPDKIPQTGIITMSFTIIILVILGIIYYIKYKKYNI